VSASAGDVFPDSVRDAPATVGLVYVALERADAPVTYEELADRVGACKASARRGVYTLREAGLVESHDGSDSPNGKLHRLAK
jgi:DNA-binding IscR family transcriptional regulator